MYQLHEFCPEYYSEGDLPSGNWEVFADGFSEIPIIKSLRDAKYRLCGLAQGPDGYL